MGKQSHWTRRDLLKASAGAFAAGVLSPGRVLGASELPPTPIKVVPFRAEMPLPRILQPVAPFATEQRFNPAFARQATQFYDQPMRRGIMQIIPGVETEIWGYNGEYPGPTVRAQAFRPVLMRRRNQLPVETVVHLHGAHAPASSDGFPADLIFPGGQRDYAYPNYPPGGDPNETPSTAWYHDHAMDITGENVYRGLCACYLLFDDLEQSLIDRRVLTGPDFDVPMVIQDKRLDADGQLFYDPMQHDGFLGDIFCANGKAQPTFHVQRRKYRFRILDGANARFYELRLSNGMPFLQIGNDSWLLPRAVVRNTVLLSPAKRADVIIDFRNVPSEVFLENILVQNDGRGPEGDLRQRKVVIPGVPQVKFIVGGSPATNDVSIAEGTPLRPMTPILPSEIVTTRTFIFERRQGAWQVNHRFFDPNRVDAVPRLNTAERWILQNGGGGWWHPIHIHLEAHQLVSFNGVPIPIEERIKSDTTILGPGDVAEIFMRFRTYPGRYVFHCHNVEHEDMRMMQRFDVG